MFRCMIPTWSWFYRNRYNIGKSQSVDPEDVELSNVEYTDTIEFVAPITTAKVIKVYDGDTITVASRIAKGLPLYRFHVRLNGIDTPEIKAKTMKEKELAVEARDALANLIMHKMVELRNNKTEKYGRILSDVYIGDIHVNKWMLDHKLAIPYDGGTKTRPENWN